MTVPIYTYETILSQKIDSNTQCTQETYFNVHREFISKLDIFPVYESTLAGNFSLTNSCWITNKNRMIIPNIGSVSMGVVAMFLYAKKRYDLFMTCKEGNVLYRVCGNKDCCNPAHILIISKDSISLIDELNKLCRTSDASIYIFSEFLRIIKYPGDITCDYDILHKLYCKFCGTTLEQDVLDLLANSTYAVTRKDVRLITNVFKAYKTYLKDATDETKLHLIQNILAIRDYLPKQKTKGDEDYGNF